MSSPIVIPKMEEMPSRMRVAARVLLEVGADLEYLGGFGQFGEKGRAFMAQAEQIAVEAQELESQLVEARR